LEVNIDIKTYKVETLFRLNDHKSPG
jgi:hypothetical protein